jgi:hypothetical protein
LCAASKLRGAGLQVAGHARSPNRIHGDLTDTRNKVCEMSYLHSIDVSRYNERAVTKAFIPYSHRLV